MSNFTKSKSESSKDLEPHFKSDLHEGLRLQLTLKCSKTKFLGVTE